MSNFDSLSLEQKQAAMVTKLGCTLLGPRDALEQATRALIQAVNTRLVGAEGAEKITTPFVREILFVLKDNAKAVLDTPDAKAPDEVFVRSFALGVTAILDGVDRLDAVLDTAYLARKRDEKLAA